MPESVRFDRVAKDYDRTRGGEERGRRFASDLEPRFRSRGTTLEVGVGTGVVAKALIDRGRRVVGADLSLPMLAEGRRRGLDAIVQADGARLPFADQTFEDAYSVWLLHLVGDLAAVLSEVHRVLKPQGRYLVVAATRQDTGDEIDSIVIPMHERLRDGLPRPDRPDLLGAAARAAGFEPAGLLACEPQPVQQSPAEAAAELEDGLLAACWDLDPGRRQAVVAPAVAALRALPEPERARERRIGHPLLVLDKR